MPQPEKNRRLARVLWCAAAVVTLLALVKFFVADVFRVDSGSMRPTILGGDGLNERVLVRFGLAEELRRFDLVVLRTDASTGPMVKRAVAFAGEDVGISGGDLLVNGSRLGIDAPRPAPVPVFDAAHHDLEDAFRFDDGASSPWSRDGDAWTLDAGAIPAGSDRALMLTKRELFDDHLDADQQRVPGRVSVHDGVLECELRIFPESAGRVVLRAVEEGDTFQCVIELGDPAGGNPPVARLTRRNARTIASTSDPDVVAGERVLAEAPLEAPEAPPADDGWHHLRFANIDNHLTLEVDGVRVLAHTYEKNEPLPGETFGPPDGVSVLGARFAFGGTGCKVAFRGVRIMRDLHYTSAGSYGVGSALSLGPGEVFVLGDNSSDSKDSRFFGPVQVSDLIGRPVSVVWPPGRMRWLEGAAP